MSVDKNSPSQPVYWLLKDEVVGLNDKSTIVSSRENSIIIGWLFVLCGLIVLLSLVFGLFYTLPSYSVANPNHIVPLLLLSVVMVIPIFVIGVCHIKGIT